MTPPHLRLLDTDTGEVHTGCPRCEEVQVDEVELLRGEITSLLRKISDLKRNRDEERRADPDRALILALIDRWKERTGHRRSNRNAADRFDLIKARLREGYTLEQLELAIDGLGAFPYVANGQRVPTGSRSQRHDRMGIALSGGEAVERFANLGALARREAV